VARLTRREALVGGVALAAVGGFVGWGRFAFGGAFENHVADTLGLDGRMARELLAEMRRGLGPDYEARASGFLAATREPGRSLLPAGTRSSAIDAFVAPLLLSGEQRFLGGAYAQRRPSARPGACRTLGRP